MKTPMVIFNDVMKKKNKKNRKGFSLVELIVVLVIMAILAAALIPSLMGYISKTKEQNINSECQSAVQAAQTIASGAYAAPDGNYEVNGVSINFTTDVVGNTTAYQTAIAYLAECPTGSKAPTISATVAASGTNQGRVTALSYQRDSITIAYALSAENIGTYTKS